MIHVHIAQKTPQTLHTLLHCTSIKTFWEKVTDSLSNFIGCHIRLSPSLCMKGNIFTINISNTNGQLLKVALTIKKKTILVNWKSRNTIHISSWKNVLIEYISIENHLCLTLKTFPNNTFISNKQEGSGARGSERVRNCV